MAMYGGGSKCHICAKSAFPFDSQSYSGRWYHDSCFKCKFCNNRIPSVTDVAEYETQLYHKTCFLKNFKESGGKYAGKAITQNATALPSPYNGKARALSLNSNGVSPLASPKALQAAFNEYSPFADKRGGTALFIIDPQADFHKGGSLAVPGAEEDSARIAQMIENNKDSISQITVTLDSHLKLHIANPYFWHNENKEHPPPFTSITEQDIKEGKWKPARPALLKHALAYANALEKGKRYTLMVWPEHCLIGTPGHNVVEPLNAALQSWSGHNLDVVQYVNKGSCPLVEMYSGLKADMELPGVKDTQLNKGLIARLLQADRLIVCGQALSHCVQFTMRDLLENWPANRFKDVILLSDGSSPVSGFETHGTDFHKDLVKRGARVLSCAEAFA